jgi:hypothetical protein
MIDTHAMYKKLLDEGYDATYAEQKVKFATELESHFDAKLNNFVTELKRDFASNKLIAVLGTLIIMIGGFTLSKVIEMDKRLAVMESKLIY